LLKAFLAEQRHHIRKALWMKLEFTFQTLTQL